MRTYLWIAFVALSVMAGMAADQCQLQDDEFFATFHPHLDAFWLNYDNQLKDINFRPAGFLYNMNQRNSKTIFNSMLEALTASPIRKYFITETFFFKDWYDYLSADKKSQVRELLKNGQLQIANAAWVENDEAVCYYDDILDQYTIGMNFLYEEFKYQNKIGWATDSFGHSHSQAALEHLLGIEFQGIERVDDRYVNQHKGQPLLEFYWIPVSDSNNQTYGGVINHVRHFLHEVNNLRGARVQSITQDFTELTAHMNAVYHKNKYFRFLGNDFEQFVTEEFRNLQKSFEQLNKQKGGSCPMYKYGNPEDYLKTIQGYYSKNKLPTRKFDFIPNWDQDRFWTGYYTTDPTLKKTCKDFSRLVNLYRKVLLSIRDKSTDKNDGPLQSAEQLLAILQHHDGITATSKTYIEDQFKNRMGQKSKQIESELNKIYFGGDLTNSETILCELYKDNNKCVLKPDRKYSLLSVITFGNAKKEKIEILLPVDHFYAVEGAEFDIFCQEGIQCRLIFEAVLFPGINQFKLITKDRSEIAGQIFEMELIDSKAMTHSGRDYEISIKQGGVIHYQFNGDEHIDFSFHKSPNKGSSRRTMSWDKYGRKSDKTEHVVPGMYIMSNTGTIQRLDHAFLELRVGEGKTYRKFILKSNVFESLEITIEIEKPSKVDFVFEFKPPNRSMVDYFLKVDSPVQSDVLFHDSNGFLVAKRELNSRPDYSYDFKKEDLINGNTYPACSFAYLISGGKKLVFFTDRAQGVASYDKSLLINFDRLAMDDGKGVGEGYSRIAKNTFHYKFALVKEKDTVQRKWQRQYDEGLIAYFSSGSKNINSHGAEIHRKNYIKDNGLGLLKYSIFHLNKDEIVLRLQNMGQFQSIEIPSFKKEGNTYKWIIKQLGLDLTASSISDSYANGIPIENKWRINWSKQPNEISLFMRSQQANGLVMLRPLEIRSYRLNFNGMTQTVSKAEIVEDTTPHEKIDNPVQKKTDKLQGYHGPRKRCFL